MTDKKTISFQVSKEFKEELNEYARSIGFSGAGALSRKGRYDYLKRRNATEMIKLFKEDAKRTK